MRALKYTIPEISAYSILSAAVETENGYRFSFDAIDPSRAYMVEETKQEDCPIFYQAMRVLGYNEKDSDASEKLREEIKGELERYRQLGVRVKVLDIPTTMTDFPDGQLWVCDMVNNILIEVLGSIAEQERITIRDRQRQGIEAAKLSGKVKFGRPKVKKPDNWDEVYAQYCAHTITGVKAIELTGLSRSTFYKRIREWDAEKAR